MLTNGNLIEGLQDEIERNKELLLEYYKIPTGGFAAIIIRQRIKEAEEAIAEGDLLKMISCYKKLRELE